MDRLTAVIIGAASVALLTLTMPNEHAMAVCQQTHSHAVCFHTLNR